MTAYEKKEKSVSASSSDIETEPEGKRNGTATPQNGAISDVKVSENPSTKQGKDVKVAENQVASGVKGVHSDTYKRIIELADTYTKELTEHENDSEWKDSYNDYSKQVEPLAKTLTDEALNELYDELEEIEFGLGMWINDILEGRRVMSMRKRVDEQTKSNEKAVSKVKMELDAMTSLVDGFSNAVYFGTMPDSTRQDGVLNHYFAYPINYNGKRSYVFCRALHDNNTNRLYVHEVFVEDKIKKGNTLQTAASQPHGGISLYRDILANVLETVAKTEPQQSTNAVSDDSLRSTKTIDGINSEEPNGKSTVSDGKDKTKSANSQENQQKTDEKVEEPQNEEVQGGVQGVGQIGEESSQWNTLSEEDAKMLIQNIKDSLLPNSSDMHLAENPNGLPDLLPTQESNESISEDKDKTKSPNPQENQQKTDEKVEEPQNEEVQGGALSNE